MSDAGWYPNPHDPTTLRYYDGQQWTEHIHALPGAGPARTATAASGSTQTAPPETSRPSRRAPRWELETGASWPAAATQHPVVEQTAQYPAGRAADGTVPPVEQQTTQYPPAEQPYGYAGYPQTTQSNRPVPAVRYPTAGPQPPLPARVAVPARPRAYQPPPKKRSRALLIVAVVVVLAVAAGRGVVPVAARQAQLTFAGKDIKDASQVLDSAETQCPRW